MRERERESSFCDYNILGSREREAERQRDREREIDRQRETDRQRERDRQRETEHLQCREREIVLTHTYR